MNARKLSEQSRKVSVHSGISPNMQRLKSSLLRERSKTKVLTARKTSLMVENKQQAAEILSLKKTLALQTEANKIMEAMCFKSQELASSYEEKLLKEKTEREKDRKTFNTSNLTTSLRNLEGDLLIEKNKVKDLQERESRASGQIRDLKKANEDLTKGYANLKDEFDKAQTTIRKLKSLQASETKELQNCQSQLQKPQLNQNLEQRVSAKEKEKDVEIVKLRKQIETLKQNKKTWKNVSNQYNAVTKFQTQPGPKLSVAEARLKTQLHEAEINHKKVLKELQDCKNRQTVLVQSEQKHLTELRDLEEQVRVEKDKNAQILEAARCLQMSKNKWRNLAVNKAVENICSDSKKRKRTEETETISPASQFQGEHPFKKCKNSEETPAKRLMTENE